MGQITLLAFRYSQQAAVVVAMILIIIVSNIGIPPYSYFDMEEDLLGTNPLESHAT
jgi:hypothetical protein